MTVKKTLRGELLGLRAALTEDYRTEASQQICLHLIQWIRQEGPFAQIFGFYPYRSEPDLSDVFRAYPSVTLGLPVVGREERRMDFHRWQQGDALVANQFGVHEPDTGKAPSLTPDDKTLILVPAVALDADGYRLGYGGGYYDTYLARFPDARPRTVGVIFGKFLRANLPREEHDRPVQAFATELGVTTVTPAG